MFSLVECTSLITRIAARVRALQGNVVLYIQPERVHLNTLMKPSLFVDISLNMLKISLLCFSSPIMQMRSPYLTWDFICIKSRVLTFQLLPREEARRSSVSGR
jgi:hypothetical protein